MAGAFTHAGTANAQSGFDPNRLALAPADFPQTAEVVESRVEPNSLVASDQILTSGPKAVVQRGRLTGYFLRVGQANVDATGESHPVITQYIASVFTSDMQSKAAFDQQRAAWDSLVLRPPPGGPVRKNQIAGVRAGEGGRLSSYSAAVGTDLGLAQATVIFFATGAALVEVWQYFLSTDARPYGEAARSSEVAIAEKLDKRIRGIPPIAPVAFHIVSLRAEQFGTVPRLDVQGLQQLRRGQNAYISVYVSTPKAPPSGVISARITLVRAGRVRGDFAVMQNWVATGGSVHRLFVPFHFGVAGAVSIRAVARINGTTQVARSSLVVAP